MEQIKQTIIHMVHADGSHYKIVFNDLLSIKCIESGNIYLGIVDKEKILFKFDRNIHSLNEHYTEKFNYLVVHKEAVTEDRIDLDIEFASSYELGPTHCEGHCCEGGPYGSGLGPCDKDVEQNGAVCTDEGLGLGPWKCKSGYRYCDNLKSIGDCRVSGAKVREGCGTSVDCHYLPPGTKCTGANCPKHGENCSDPHNTGQGNCLDSANLRCGCDKKSPGAIHASYHKCNQCKGNCKCMCNHNKKPDGTTGKCH